MTLTLWQIIPHPLMNFSIFRKDPLVEFGALHVAKWRRANFTRLENYETKKSQKNELLLFRDLGKKCVRKRNLLRSRKSCASSTRHCNICRPSKVPDCCISFAQMQFLSRKFLNNDSRRTMCPIDRPLQMDVHPPLHTSCRNTTVK